MNRDTTLQKVSENRTRGVRIIQMQRTVPPLVICRVFVLTFESWRIYLPEGIFWTYPSMVLLLEYIVFRTIWFVLLWVLLLFGRMWDTHRYYSTRVKKARDLHQKILRKEPLDVIDVFMCTEFEVLLMLEPGNILSEGQWEGSHLHLEAMADLV